MDPSTLLPQPTANPVLSEIMGLSPQAKTALSMAGHTMQGAVPQLPAPTPPNVSVRPSMASMMPQDAGQVPKVEPIHMPSSVPQLGAPTMPNVVAPRGTVQGDMNERGRLLDTGAGEDQIYSKIANSNFGQNHPIIGKLLGGAAEGAARVGDIGLSAVSPGLASLIPGTEYHHDVLLNQANKALEGSDKEAQSEAATANTEAQAGEHRALAEKAGTVADQMVPTALSAEDAKAIGHPEFEGMMMSPHDKAKFFGTTQTNDTRQTVGAGHDTAKVTTTGMNNATSVANNEATNKTRETLAQAADKTRTLIAQMHDSTSRANNENSVSHRGTTAGGNFKVPADVTKRAALASNVLENADEVEKLIKARPDLVGAAGGRYTSIQQMIGSDDPDIAALGVRMHNIALASNGAHGLRSQQAVQQTEDELFNHFKTGAHGIEGALNATRGSMKTFLDDENNFSTSGKRESGEGDNGPSLGNTTKADGVYEMNGKQYRVEGGKVYAH